MKIIENLSGTCNQFINRQYMRCHKYVLTLKILLKKKEQEEVDINKDTKELFKL